MKKQTVEKGWTEIRAAVEELQQHRDEEKKNISTLTFLSLSNIIIHVLDKIGPTMAVFRQDIHRNIERLEEVYLSDPLVYYSLLEILEKEVGEGTVRKPDSCAKAVVWLTRSISFSVALLERLDKDSQMSLEQIVEEAYKGTLKPWHGWISSAAYKVATKLIPDKSAFIELLIGQGQDYEALKGDIDELLALLLPVVDEINALLREHRIDRLKST